MAGGYVVDVSVLPTFFGAVVLICLAPGPDMVYMVGTGVAGGRSAATRAAFGVSLGVVVYAVAVAAGLGAVVSDHPGVLTAIEAFGCLYLLWLAAATFRDARRGPVPGDLIAAEYANWFRRGLVVNLSNPKVLLFFVAFLPQFIGSATSPTLQLLLLGLLFQAVGLAIDLAIGWSAGCFRDKVLARPGALRAMTYTSGSVFVVLAIIVGNEAALTLTT